MRNPLLSLLATTAKAAVSLPEVVVGAAEKTNELLAESQNESVTRFLNRSVKEQRKTAREYGYRKAGEAVTAVSTAWDDLFQEGEKEVAVPDFMKK